MNLKKENFTTRLRLALDLHSLTAILNRTAAYIGREIVWQDMLDPDKAWEADINLYGLSDSGLDLDNDIRRFTNLQEERVRPVSHAGRSHIDGLLG